MVDPNEKLMLGITFALCALIALVVLEVCHLIIMHEWRSEISWHHESHRRRCRHILWSEELMKGKPWTDEEEKRLRVLTEDKTPVESIAKILKKTPSCSME